MFFKQFIALIALTTLLLCGCKRDLPVDTQVEAEKIQELSHQWTTAINAGDIDRIINLYSTDAVQMQGGSQAIIGHDAIRKWYESWVTDPELSYSATTVKIDIASSLDLAYERGTYSFNQTTPKGPIKEIGKYLTIWKKLGGEWKAIIDTGTPDNALLP